MSNWGIVSLTNFCYRRNVIVSINRVHPVVGVVTVAMAMRGVGIENVNAVGIEAEKVEKVGTVGKVGTKNGEDIIRSEEFENLVSVGIRG